MNFFKDLAIAVRDFTGGRSKSMEQAIDAGIRTVAWVVAQLGDNIQQLLQRRLWDAPQDWSVHSPATSDRCLDS